MNPTARVPPRGDYVLRDARVPASVLVESIGPSVEGCVRTDVVVRDGKIAAIEPPFASDLPAVDLDGGLSWPICVAFTLIRTRARRCRAAVGQ